MTRTLTLSLLATACLCAAPQVLANSQDRGSAQETQQSREQAAREQAARDQQAREQAARQKQQQEQQRIDNARQEQQRILKARAQEASQTGGQSPEALFRKFKVEESQHRERVARIAALRRHANARQNQARVAELDQLLARENERYGEWIRRTRNALGEEEFENQRARIDGRAVRPVQRPPQQPTRPQ